METLREMAKKRHKTIRYKLANVRYFICNVLDFPYHFKRIKWFIQRGKRGYADCDWWCVYSYLTDITIPMLKKLKENNRGHPATLTEKKWVNILSEMIKGFEAGERLTNYDNWVSNKDSDMYVDENGYMQFTNPWTEEQIKEFKKLDKDDDEIFKKGMKLFSKWFLNLWD